MPSSDPYDVLGVDPGADAATIRAAYLALIREHHPDHRPGDPGEFARSVNAAYRILGDDIRRAAHDRRHAARMPPPATTPAPVVRPPAYSEERRRVQRSFSEATLRYALALFVVGTVLLLSLAAQ